MGIYILLVSIIIILAAMLVHSYYKTNAAVNEREQLIHFRDTVLNLTDKILKAPESADLYQYILESCIRLMPKARCGSILMFNPEGLLAPKASVGFSRGISELKLKLEDSFIYIAAGGRLAGPVLINRLEDIMPKKTIVTSPEQDSDLPAEEQNTGSGIKSEAAAPIYSGGELIGLLCIDGDKPDIFTTQDIFILDFISCQISTVFNNQKLNRELQHLSRYDEMTHLLNRSSLEQEAVRLLSDPSKDSGNLHFVLINLDGLRIANEAFGHQFGDEIIRAFSDIIKLHLGKNDFCGRYGGDEFVAVVQGDYLHVNFTMEEIKKEFAALKNVYADKDYTPGFSYGYASFREGLGILDNFYKLASNRMREMKAANKDNKKQ
jgi:diguanylate cyclase (GGDEF)-like protein